MIALLPDFGPFLMDYFRDALPRFVTLIVPPLILVALFAIIFDLLGSGLGLAKLFWSRSARRQFFHGFMVALVVGHTVFVSHLLDYDIWVNRALIAGHKEDGLPKLQSTIRRLTRGWRLQSEDGDQTGAVQAPPRTWANSEGRPWITRDPPDYDYWNHSRAFRYYYVGHLVGLAILVLLLWLLRVSKGRRRQKPSREALREQKEKRGRTEEEEDRLRTLKQKIALRNFAYGERRIWLPIGFLVGAALIFGVSFALGELIEPKVSDQDTLARPSHFAALGIAVLLVVIFGLLQLPGLKWVERMVTPAISLCLLLAFIDSLFGGIVYLLRLGDLPLFGFVVILGLVLILFWSSYRNPFRYRFEFLAAHYPQPRPLLPNQALPPTNAALDFKALFASDHQRAGQPYLIMCMSGGGITAAVWAVNVLTELEKALAGRKAGFELARATRLVCGASGGMVGAAHWAGALTATGSKLTADELKTSIAEDTLSEVARYLVTHDLPRVPLPIRLKNDRGAVQDACWISTFGNHMSHQLDALLEGERDGWRPPLVFTPTILEMGRRLVIGNVDLTEVIDNRVQSVDLHDSGIDLRRLFPGQAGEIPLATAARMSASFPVVSPAAALPTTPQVRLGDAGYFDNWGVSVAASWLQHHLDDIPDDARIVLLEFDAYPKSRQQEKAVFEGRDEIAPSHEPPGKVEHALRRILEDFTAPVQGALKTRSSAIMLRNDELLETFQHSLRARKPKAHFTYIPLVNTFPASLSWILTGAEIAELDRSSQEEVRRKIDDIVEAATNPPASSGTRKSEPPGQPG